MTKSIHRFPLLPLAAAFITGILLYDNFISYQSINYILFSLSVFLIILFTVATKDISRSVIQSLGILFLFVILGYFNTWQITGSYKDLEPYTSQATDTIIGEVRNFDKYHATLDLHRINNKVIPGTILIPKSDCLTDLEIESSQVIVVGKIKRITNTSLTHEQFNPLKYYASKGIFYRAYIDTCKIFSYGKSAEQRVNKKIQKRINNDFGNSSSYFIVSALLLGARVEQPKLRKLFADTGNMHLLAISGLHLGIIYFILTTIFRPGIRTRWQRVLSVLLIISSLWAFALFTGGKSSALRAALMFSLFAIAKLSQQKTNSINILSAAAIFLLMVNPYLLWDVGFQLSFTAMIGIVTIASGLIKKYPKHNPPIQWLFGVLFVSFAAVISTAPISLYYFHQIAPASIIYSPITILFTICIIGLVLLWLMSLKIPILHDLAVELINKTVNIFVDFLQWLHQMDELLIHNIWISPYTAIICTLCLMAVSIFTSHWNRKTIVYALTISSLGLFTHEIFKYNRQRKEVFVAHTERDSSFFSLCKDGHFFSLNQTVYSKSIGIQNAYFTTHKSPHPNPIWHHNGLVKTNNQSILIINNKNNKLIHKFESIDVIIFAEIPKILVPGLFESISSNPTIIISRELPIDSARTINYHARKNKNQVVDLRYQFKWEKII